MVDPVFDCSWSFPTFYIDAQPDRGVGADLRRQRHRLNHAQAGMAGRRDTSGQERLKDLDGELKPGDKHFCCLLSR